MSTLPSLLPDELPPEPFVLMGSLFDEAWSRRDQPNPNAMSLATCTPDGHPSLRIVLCKRIDPSLGFISFFTNYQSRKGSELEANPRAAATFHWDHQDRQVRLEGLIVRSPAEESDDYFGSRAMRSRLGAWASQQSQPIASREALREQLRQTFEKFGLDPSESERPEERPVPRPENWGGYRLWPERVEIWQGERSRLHDRALWSRTLIAEGEGFRQDGPWNASRLQP